MSIISRHVANVNRRTVKASIVTFDGTKPHRAPRTFGRGLNRYTGTFSHEPYTAEELAWSMVALNDCRRDAEYDRHIEAMAMEYENQDRLDRGICY